MNEFYIKCAVAKYKSKPIKLTIDRMTVELAEPEVMLYRPRAPLPRRGKYTVADRIGDGLTVDIKHLTVIVRTRGLYKKAPQGGPWTPPVMRMQFSNVSFCATNARWQPNQSLNRLWRENYKQNEVMVYRKVTLGSAKVTLERPVGPAAATGTASTASMPSTPSDDTAAAAAATAATTRSSISSSSSSSSSNSNSSRAEEGERRAKRRG